jgi:MFS family permease
MQYKWTVLSNTTLGGLMASIDGSILLISLPVVFKGLGVNAFAASSFPLLIWLLLGYGIVTATLLVTFGRLSDMLGRARLYNLGFAIFAAGSLMLFFEPWQGSTGAWALVYFRMIQAVGAAFLFSNSAALLTDAFPQGERGKAMGVNQIAFIGGSLVGLVVGGIIAGIAPLHLGPIVIPTWRLIFLVSVPVSTFGAVWAYWQLREISTRRADQHLDIVGNVTFAAGLTTILVGITYGLLPYGGSSMGWSSPWVTTALGSGAAMLVAFVFIELRARDPMFHLSFFRIRAFAAGTSSALLGSLARGGLMIVLVVWFQGIWLPLHGYSFSQTPLYAGFMMTPMIVGFLVAGPLSGWLSDRYGARPFATTGLVLAVIAFFAMATLPVDFVYWQMGVLLFVNGCGMGMFAAPNASAVMSSVPAEDRGSASGMLATLQNTGQQMSLAIFFTIVIVGLSSGLGPSSATALAAAGVPPADTAILSHLIGADPTGSLFGAFLGENPMTALLAVAQTVPGWVAPAPSATWPTTVLAPHFFATAIKGGFGTAISEAFYVAGSLVLVAAAVSALRGAQYFHADASRPAPAGPGTAPSPVAATSPGILPVTPIDPSDPK